MNADDGLFRFPVRLSRADLRKLDQEARSQGMVVGYYMDLILANEANRLRLRDGEPQQQSPIVSDSDPWHTQVPTGEGLG